MLSVHNMYWLLKIIKQCFRKIQSYILIKLDGQITTEFLVPEFTYSDSGADRIAQHIYNAP